MTCSLQSTPASASRVHLSTHGSQRPRWARWESTRAKSSSASANVGHRKVISPSTSILLMEARRSAGYTSFRIADPQLQSPPVNLELCRLPGRCSGRLRDICGRFGGPFPCLGTPRQCPPDQRLNIRVLLSDVRETISGMPLDNGLFHGSIRGSYTSQLRDVPHQLGQVRGKPASVPIEVSATASSR